MSSKGSELITQSHGQVTVPSGRIPVLLGSHAADILAQMAVNFLRSGCPMVQVIFEVSPGWESRLASLRSAIDTLSGEPALPRGVEVFEVHNPLHPTGNNGVFASCSISRRAVRTPC